MTTSAGGRPWRLAGIALLWMLAADVCGSILAILLAGTVTRMTTDWKWGQPLTAPIFLTIGFATQAILLFGTWRQARSTPVGNLPVQRRWIVAGLVLLSAAEIGGLVVLANTVPAVRRAAASVTSILDLAMTAGSGALVAAIVLAAIVAPGAEELFFRGWLWTGFRRSWGPVATAMVTSGAWLLGHIGSGFYKPLFLIPAAVILSLARHYGGSVRASITVHAAMNLIAIVVSIAAP